MAYPSDRTPQSDVTGQTCDNTGSGAVSGNPMKDMMNRSVIPGAPMCLGVSALPGKLGRGRCITGGVSRLSAMDPKYKMLRDVFCYYVAYDQNGLWYPPFGTQEWDSEAEIRVVRDTTNAKGFHRLTDDTPAFPYLLPALAAGLSHCRVSKEFLVRNFLTLYGGGTKGIAHAIVRYDTEPEDVVVRWNAAPDLPMNMDELSRIMLISCVKELPIEAVWAYVFGRRPIYDESKHSATRPVAWEKKCGYCTHPEAGGSMFMNAQTSRIMDIDVNGVAIKVLQRPFILGHREPDGVMLVSNAKKKLVENFILAVNGTPVHGFKDLPISQGDLLRALNERLDFVGFRTGVLDGHMNFLTVHFDVTYRITCTPEVTIDVCPLCHYIWDRTMSMVATIGLALKHGGTSNIVLKPFMPAAMIDGFRKCSKHASGDLAKSIVRYIYLWGLYVQATLSVPPGFEMPSMITRTSVVHAWIKYMDTIMHDFEVYCMINMCLSQTPIMGMIPIMPAAYHTYALYGAKQWPSNCFQPHQGLTVRLDTRPDPLVSVSCRVFEVLGTGDDPSKCRGWEQIIDFLTRDGKVDRAHAEQVAYAKGMVRIVNDSGDNVNQKIEKVTSFLNKWDKA